MSEIKLTKEADTLICVLYHEYSKRRKSGMSKSDAKCFPSSHDIQKEFLPKLHSGDVNDTCNELENKGLAENYYGDGIALHVTLTDEAIVYMENRFKDGVAGVISYAEKVLSLILH